MGNTTFSGPVRSETTFKSVSKNATTGAITEIATLGDAPVSLADGNVTITNATHSGRIIVVPNGGQDNTYSLPTPVAGAIFRFIYGGVAADATDFIIDAGSNTNYFIGSVTHLDSDAGSAADEIGVVFPDGNSNSILQVNIPGGCDITVVAVDNTNWLISGWVSSATVPAFSDQA